MSKHPKQLLLASASPRRAELLDRMGLSFQVRPTHVIEYELGLHGALHLVKYNARHKAKTLALREPHALIIGCDTTVVIDDTILNKPKDLVEARSMLNKLSGHSHNVLTAVAIYWKGGDLKELFYEKSIVRFKVLNAEIIEQYINLVNPLDKAGAYGIQKHSDLIIDEVEGSVENVMGLPIQKLGKTLDNLGFDFRR